MKRLFVTAAAVVALAGVAAAQEGMPLYGNYSASVLNAYGSLDQQQPQVQVEFDRKPTESIGSSVLPESAFSTRALVTGPVSVETPNINPPRWRHGR